MGLPILIYLISFMWFVLMFYIVYKISNKDKKIETTEDLHGRYARIVNPPEDINVVVVKVRMNDQDVKLIAVNTTRRKKEVGDRERLSIIDGVLHV